MKSIGNTNPKAPAKERLWLRAGTLLGFLLLLGAALALPVLLAASAWIPLAVLLLAVLLAWPPALWWARRRGRSVTTPWFKSALGLFCLLCALLAAPVYFLALVTVLRPSVQPQVVLSNGSRSLTFQGMIHVGSDTFYRSVIFDIERALTEGAVIFYEGVKPDPEGDAWLDSHAGSGGGLDQGYAALASTCGLVYQAEYFKPLGPDMKARPERHVQADVSTLEMKREYERLLTSDPAFAAAMKTRDAARSRSRDGKDDSGDVLSSFLDWQKRGTDSQRNLAATVCRGIMTIVSRPRPATQATDADRDPLDAVILDYRNRQLADRILSNTNSRIFMTYGSAHLPGVYELLRRADPRWKVESVKWMRSIAAPDHVQGELNLEP